MGSPRTSSQTGGELASELVSFFGSRPEVLAAYLFGSRAGGVVTPLSDVDVGVLVCPAEYERAEQASRWGYKAELDVALRRALKRKDVDIVILNGAGTVLVHEVVARGRLLLCKDESYRIAFEVEALLRYLDTKPLRAVFTEQLERRIREGRFAER